MFQKYMHFRQRKFKGNWIKRAELDTGFKIEFREKVYFPESSLEDIKIIISEKALDDIVKFRLKKKPELIAEYVREHFFRSVLYSMESMAKNK